MTQFDDTIVGENLPLPRVGPYAMGEVLGQGAMGTVYRASGPEGSVAIKVLHATLMTEEVGWRFFHEASIRIEHRNVVRIFDSGTTDDGRLYMVLELLDGETLGERIRSEPFTPKDAVAIAIQVARGLAAVHESEIVHRDLKPENLFIQRDGIVKILDFGVARFGSAENRRTLSGAVLGTPSYLAPEQARGDPNLDARADLWALGVILYEALAGAPPFDRGSVMATVVAVLMEPAPPLASRATALPAELCEIVDRCLEKDPARRWQTAAEIAAALEGLEGLEPVQKRSASAIPVGEQRLVVILLAQDVAELSVVEQAIVTQGGIFSPTLGRCAIGVFGAERWEGDELERAVSAGLACRDAAGRIGVAIGRARSSEGLIAGDGLIAAERACELEVSGIALDLESASMLPGQFRVRPAAAGHLEVIEVADSIEPAASSSGPIVGRKHELLQAQLAMSTVADRGTSAVALIVGPPGSGKTRLRAELVRMARDVVGSGRVLTASSRPTWRDASLRLFRSLIEHRAMKAQGAFGIGRLTAPASIEERRKAVHWLACEAIADEVEAHDCALFLGELLGVRMGSSPALDAARAAPELMADRLRFAVQDYVAGLLQQGPLALVFDDLHWADPVSLELMADLAIRHANDPLLLIGATREELLERKPDLFSGSDLISMRLRGLGRLELEELSTRAAGRELPPALIDALLERTDGNPLFIVQMVRALRESDRVEQPPADLPLPLSVEAAVQSRLDHLPRLERELCRRASLFGRPFALEEVVTLVGEEARALVDSLERRNLLTSGGARGSRRYAFQSTLVSDVAYRSLDVDVLEELHSRAAAMLATRTGVDREEVATHYERGGKATEAAEAFADVALGAVKMGDAARAIRCGRRALELGVPGAQRYAVHMALADSHRFLGAREQQRRELDTALGLATEDAERARVLLEQAVYSFRGGRAHEALPIAEEAVAAARRAGDENVLLLARGWQSAALAYAGKRSEAREALDEASTISCEHAPWLRARIAEWRGLLASLEGDVGACRHEFEEAFKNYLDAGELRRAAAAQLNVADAFNRMGAHADAETAIVAALERGRRVGQQLTEGYAYANLGYARAALGRFDEALTTLDAATAIAERSRDERLALAVDVYRLRARLRRGDPPALIALEAARAADRGAKLELPSYTAAAHVVAARAHLAANDPEAALSHSRPALALRDESGGLEEDEATVFLAHVHALEACGLVAEAAEVRARGRQRLLEVSERIGDPAWRARFLRDVPANRELAGDPASG